MNIHELEIAGFGAWTGLRLENFEPGINVIYGPNEAGKSTLLQFIRSMLYGVPERGRRFLPPLSGGPAGGSLRFDAAEGGFHLRRRFDFPPNARHADGSPVGAWHGEVTLTRDNGQEVSHHRLPDLLGGVDEATFNNVFAVGLHEMQELATINDTGAARLLYNLTTGLDRVSLGQVMRDLHASRQELLAPVGRDSQIGRLLGEQSRLETELADLGNLTQRYASLTHQRQQVQHEIARLEAEIGEQRDAVRLHETALSLRDKWAERSRLDLQLSALGASIDIPAGSLERLESLDSQVRARQGRIRKLQSQRKQLRVDARKLPLNRPLLERSARIQAMADQQEWIANLEKQAATLADDVAAIEVEIEAQREQLGVDADTSPELLRGLTVRSLAPLKPLARAMRDSQNLLDRLRQESTGGRDTAETLNKQIQTALSAQPQSDLVAAVERAGRLVSQLRRRVQLDGRLERMNSQQQVLQDESAELMDRQLLPLGAVAALGGVFVLGVVLVLAGWWLSFGFGVALLGVAAIIGTMLMKRHMEQTAQQQLDNCDKQLKLLGGQIKQLKSERSQLDVELPQGGGPPLARLETAESELERLEALLPLEAQRKTVVQDSVSAQQRLKDAESACTESQRRWRQALHSAGWPAKLSPKQVWALAGRCRQLRELYRRQEQRQEEQRQAATSVSAFADRLTQLLADVELMPPDGKPSTQLRYLRKELSEQESLGRQRKELVDRDRQIARRQVQHRRLARRLLARRRTLLMSIGAVDDADFRRRVADSSRIAQLKVSREAVERDIAAALGKQFSEELLRRHLDSLPETNLDQHWEQLASRLQACESELRQLFERRGQLQQQLQTLADDRRLPQRQLELGIVRQRLATAIGRWQASAVTSSLLESVRRMYEGDRQPATLQEASRYLHQLTGGRYGRIWTPMDDDLLFVDDSQGRSQRVESLSRGTREQMFLSLRLALIGDFARRGVRLPVVLDDVFVNFDSQRTRAAASLLCDFAQAGHQLLVFTCHEHISRLFKSLRVSVRQLPSRFADGEPIASEPRFEEPIVVEPVKKTKKRKPPEPAPTPVIAIAPPRPPMAQPLVEEPTAPMIVEPEPKPVPVAIEVPLVVLPPPPPRELKLEPIDREPIAGEYELAPPQRIGRWPSLWALDIEPTIEPTIENVVEPVVIEPAPPPRPPVARRPEPTPLWDESEPWFNGYDGEFPVNEEPLDTSWLWKDEPWQLIEQRWSDFNEPWPPPPKIVVEEPRLAVEDEWEEIEEPWPAMTRSVSYYDGFFRGEGAEEFDGEFAVRPPRELHTVYETVLPDWSEPRRLTRRRKRKTQNATADGDFEAA